MYKLSMGSCPWGWDSKAVSFPLVTSLKSCANEKDLCQGHRLHAKICRSSLLETNIDAGNTLVSMYAKCRMLAKAAHVLEELPIRDAVSWSSLIAGYSQQGMAEEALGCYKWMQSEGLFPNAITCACLLKACGIMRELDTGQRIHDEIVRQGLLEKDVVLGNALVDMYAKCGEFTKAHVVIDKLPVRDSVSWNSLIAGYIQRGQCKEALDCFQQMRGEGLYGSAPTYTCILKACGIMLDSTTGKEIHDEIVSQGMVEKDVVLGTALVDMYSKCGLLAEAQEVFDSLSIRNIVTWSALIAGYAQHEQDLKSLCCFQQMKSEGVAPNAVTYVSILKACGISQDAKLGKSVHSSIISQELREDVKLGNALVDMYAKCGLLQNAQDVLQDLHVRDTVSWNSLMAGYIQQGKDKEALSSFRKMQEDGLRPNASTYVSVLKACGAIQESEMGICIHDEILSGGLLEKYFEIGSALVDMYAKCGLLGKAQEVFDQLPYRDVVGWNALIAAYTKHGQAGKAFGCFESMQSESISPDAMTYTCILKACGMQGEADIGQQVHDEIVSRGLLESNVLLGTALVDMYAKCGMLMRAQEVLNELPICNVVSWNALIAGYALEGREKEALSCLVRMLGEGLSPDAITYACILHVCGNTQDADIGKKLHDEILSKGLFDRAPMLGTALVDMYAKCGVLRKAERVLEELPILDAVPWNVLIAGYVQHSHGQEALGCFRQMQSEGISPNVVTYASILKACGIMEEADIGKDLHDQIIREGLLEKDVVLGTALVDMYAKCGMLTKAGDVLDVLPVRNVISWSALIAGYARCGQSKQALICFECMRIEGMSPNLISWNTLIRGFAQQGLVEEALGCFQWMQEEGIPPDAITFVHILNACSHSGRINEGQMYFESMTEKYGIALEKEHHTCMVDLFARARHFDQAIRVLKASCSDHLPMWFAFLGACRQWGDVELGRFAFKHVVQLDGSNNAALFVLMNNICATAGMQEDAQNIECMCIRNSRDVH